MVLVVFFMLLMVGLVVYSKIKQNSIAKKINEKEQIESIAVATKILQLPEMQCSETMCINCKGAVDLLKLRALAESCKMGEEDEVNAQEYTYPVEGDSVIATNRITYAKMFGTTTIRVHVTPDIFSGSDTDLTKEVYTLYDAKGYLTTSLTPYYIPINVYNAEEDSCLMGIMEIKKWS